VIRVTELTKTFEDFTALNKLNLCVNKGSVYGLVGVNGSGKTTIIKHLAGIYSQDGGEVTIDGQKVFDNVDIKKRVGYIPDDLYFFPSYTINALARFYSKIYKTWNKDRFDSLLKGFNLDGGRKLNKLSKGMQKQVMFAYVMAVTPDILILDEPLDGLDPIVRRQVISIMMEDVAAREMTVLVSSHNLKEMDGICDSVGIMKNGRMIIERSLDDLKTDVHKVQIAFPVDDTDISEKLQNLIILRKEKVGSMYLMVIRGKESDVIQHLQALNPMVMDILPLTLEEVFMYETEQSKEVPL
jgi:ABC-2 type transport system ATP-binding protein